MSVLARDSPLLTVHATAERLSVSEKTVRRLIDAGILPAVRVSAGAIRVEQAKLDEWIGERRMSGSTVGSGSSPDHAPSAVGLGSSVDASASLSSRSRSPDVRRPGPGDGQSSQGSAAGEER